MPEVWLAWGTLAAILVALLTATLARGRGTAFALGLGAAVLVGATILRCVATGHLPVFGTFEESLGSVSVILIHAVLLAGKRDRALPAAVAAGVGGLLLLHGLLLPTTRWDAVTISEVSLWLDLHVLVAWFATAAFSIAAGGAVWVLAAGGERAESLLHRSLQITFVVHTVVMLSGAWYGYLLFGSAFVFDPIELLALVAWLATASVLHLRAYRGLRGSAFAVLGLVTVAVMLLSFRLIVHLAPFSTYHIIDMDLRLHL